MLQTDCNICRRIIVAPTSFGSEAYARYYIRINIAVVVYSVFLNLQGNLNHSAPMWINDNCCTKVETLLCYIKKADKTRLHWDSNQNQMS